MLLGLLVTLLILTLVVSVHEFGHYYWAKRNNVFVHEFSIGLGKVIYQKKYGETLFSIRLIPLGGFCNIAGEDIFVNINKGHRVGLELNSGEVTKIHLSNVSKGEVSGTIEDLNLSGDANTQMFITIDGTSYNVKDYAEYEYKEDLFLHLVPKERQFNAMSKPHRVITLAAGAIMNVILGIVLSYFLYFFTLSPVVDTTEIGTLSSEQAQKHLKIGDHITHIEGVEVNDWSDISSELAKYEGLEEIDITLENDGSTRTETINTSIYYTSLGFSNEVDIDNYESLVVGEVSRDKKNKYEDSFNFKTGSKILSVYDGSTEVPVSTWDEFSSVLFSNKSEAEISIKYETDGITYTNNFELFSSSDIEALDLDYSYTTIGISPTTKFKFFDFIKFGFLNGINVVKSSLTQIKLLITSSQLGINDLSGPVGMASAVSDGLQHGFRYILGISILITIGIGIANLLPLPILDGGRIVLIGIEKLIGKEIPKEIENMIFNISIILMIILTIIVLKNDILRAGYGGVNVETIKNIYSNT